MMESMMMGNAEITLMISLLAIPAAIWLQIWVKSRKQKRLNEIGDEEFENTGKAFVSILFEGSAMIGGLMLVIVATTGVAKYILNFYM
jgi:hypothetical protein